MNRTQPDQPTDPTFKRHRRCDDQRPSVDRRGPCFSCSAAPAETRTFGQALYQTVRRFDRDHPLAKPQLTPIPICLVPCSGLEPAANDE